MTGADVAADAFQEERNQQQGTELQEGQAVLETEEVTVLPLLAEQLVVGKRVVKTGRVQIHTQVHERQEVVDLPLVRQSVSVKTVPIGRIIDGPLPTQRQEGDTLIVPIFEEVLVVAKRWRLKEELHIRQVQETFHAPQSVTLLHEEVIIERTPLTELTEESTEHVDPKQ